jgi:hypothetical protein
LKKVNKYFVKTKLDEDGGFLSNPAEGGIIGLNKIVLLLVK